MGAQPKGEGGGGKPKVVSVWGRLMRPVRWLDRNEKEEGQRRWRISAGKKRQRVEIDMGQITNRTGGAPESRMGESPRTAKSQ